MQINCLYPNVERKRSFVMFPIQSYKHPAKFPVSTDLNNQSIPLRWSAPESISKGEFSKSSDIWMVGHLFYEVLTHGLLPYSTFLPLDADNEFVEAVRHFISAVFVCSCYFCNKHFTQCYTHEYQWYKSNTTLCKM